MKTKTKIKKDDYVQVTSGKEAGKRGRVLRVFPEKNLVLVEGINYIYRHMKKNRKNMQGGRIQKEAPISISKVSLYCHHCQSVTGACYRYEEQVETDKKKEGAEAHSSKPKKVRCCTCSKHLKI